MAAIDAAFCSAARVTLAGSMMPALTQVVELAGRRVHADRALGGLDLAHDDRALEAGVVGDVAGRRDERLPHRAGTGRLVAFQRVDDLQHGADGHG